MTKTRKKLIEVALPLEAINVASAREKSIRHGHPSTLHLWWARRPLAAARAVIFSQMVDDPSEYTDVLLSDPPKRRKAERELKKRLELWKLKRAQGMEDPGPEPTLTEMLAELERERLFDIIRKLVLWENTTNEVVLDSARAEIWQSWRRTCADNADHPRAKELFNRNKLPAFHDPFAGGGSLPLEAQRLGLEAHASDLNPVAVLINKAMIEIPPKFAGKPPVNPEARKDRRLLDREWTGAQGLAEDVRYYGKWMHDEAEKRIGHLYPVVEITSEMAEERTDLTSLVGEKLTVIAWLWARTVKSPNPAFADAHVPLVSTFMLSTKPGKEVYVEPVIENDSYQFTVRVGRPEEPNMLGVGTRAGKAQDFICLLSGTPILRSYIRDQGKTGRLGCRLLAIVAEGKRGRVYLSPDRSHETIATSAQAIGEVAGARKGFLSITTPTRAMITGGVCSAYGLTTFGDLFTARQLAALTTYSDLVEEVRDGILRDMAVSGLPGDQKPVPESGARTSAYADAVSVYLAFVVSKLANIGSSLASWMNDRGAFRETFARQAIPMVWDFVEANSLADAGGSMRTSLEKIALAISILPAKTIGSARQADACHTHSTNSIISTDPPYYDNIGYADLSDFFYVWLRHSLQPVFPELFATLATPKADELVATLYRHGTKEKAEAFFLEGMTRAMSGMAENSQPAFPVTIYYAFKQSESEGATGTASTGWETFLEAVIQAGFGITGTWPIRTESSGRMIAKGTNALASSILLVCRRHTRFVPVSTRREFLNALKAELPVALTHLQRGNIAPVDLAQAAIGPGMAVFTRYERVLDAEGRPLSVRQALALINETLDEVLAEQEGDFDSDTRWALAWFEQFGFAEGEFGVAEVLSKAKATSVEGMRQGGFLASQGGKVRLLRPAELPADWDPESDSRITVWETLHQLVRALEAGGDMAAASLVSRLGARAEVGRELAYRLYTVCERKKRAAEALSYNGLVQSWPEIMRLTRDTQEAQTVAATTPARPPAQGAFALEDQE